MVKGIVLAGGSGTRLYPNTRAISKQLIPVYDKPMIYYPLSVLMLSGIRDILIISTEIDLPAFKRLLGDGSQWGIRLSYQIQEKPEGIAQAFIIAEDFIAKQPVCLILGDNIFYSENLLSLLQPIYNAQSGAHIFGYYVKNPQHYGVASFDDKGQLVDLIEKPQNPPSPWAITGLYFYDGEVSSMAKSLKPSARGELEVTDLSRAYLAKNQLTLHYLPRGSAWLDTGTFDGLHQASQFVEKIEKRQGLKIACLEEIALHNKWISKHQIMKQIKFYGDCDYSKYLKKLISL
jgi:glucose-1-phosphate thymidylyltransferase